MKRRNRQSIPARLLAFILTLMMLNPGMILLARAASLAVNDTVYAIDEDGNSQSYTIDALAPTDGSITVTHNGQTLLLSDSAISSACIVVESGVEVTLVLDGANRSSNTTSPLEIKAGAEVTLILIDGSKNRFTCTGTNATQGTAQAGINVAVMATLTILAEEGNTGTLIAEGGRYSAGIGAGPNRSCGAITIVGGVIVAKSGGGDSIPGSGNGAGIGGGGGHSMGGGHSEEIRICGEAEVRATSLGDGAGIGGSGGGKNLASDTNTSGGASGGDITISGNASVTASSEGNGAGIGGGGASTNTNFPNAGAGGDISISGNASVIATTEGNGAGIGGGGSPGTGAAGTGGDITIFDAVSVTASSKGNGAGIGGGGSSGTGTAGAGGNITIFGKPTVTAKTNNAYASTVDMGPGFSNNSGLGAEGTITITGGNVHAQRTAEVTNGLGDILAMRTVIPSVAAGESVYYAVTAASGEHYTYQAIANASSETYVWIPDTSVREVTITVVGKTTEDAMLYSVDFRVAVSDAPYSINPLALPVLTPMWKLAGGEEGNLTRPSITKDEQIELIYETGLADVTIYAKEHGTDVILQTVTIPSQEIGKPYSHWPLSILGYELVDSGGTNVAPGNQTITVTASNEITFYYKKASGNQVVICTDDETGAELSRTQIQVPVTTQTSIPVPAIPSYTTTETAETVTWDGLEPLEDITYLYTRDKQALTLHAYNALNGTRIGTVEELVSALRVEETYNYESNLAALTTKVNDVFPGQYILAQQGSAQWHVETVAANNVVKVYYNPVQSGTIPVECRIGSQTGTPIHSYTIPAAPGQTIALTEGQMPDLSGLGFEKDSSASQMSGTESGSGIIFVYQDKRFVTKIENDVDTDVIIERTVVGSTKVLYPPYKVGYVPTKYSIDGGLTMEEIDSDFTGYSADDATTIKFYYESYLPVPTTGGLTILVTSSSTGTPLAGATVTVSAGGTPLTGIPPTGTSGKVELTDIALDTYTITVSRSGYRSASASTTLNTLSASQTITIVLSPNDSGGSGTPDASLTIRCVDEQGATLFEQTVSAVTGKTETIYAPPLRGYSLAQGEPGSRSCRILPGKNEVTFRYIADEVELEDPKIPTGDGRPPVSSAIKETLETEEHIRYIQGFPDGTVRPEENISRAEAAAIFWRLIRDAEKNDTAEGAFHDVNGDKWYAQAVNYLAGMGVVTGYEDGSFRPQNAISRAEFAAMIARFDELETADIEPFADISEQHWACDYVISAYLKGWMSGYPAREFRPESPITRAEVVMIVNRMLGRGIQAKNIPSNLHGLYPDLPANHWAFAEIIEASVEHDYERLENGYETHVTY